MDVTKLEMVTKTKYKVFLDEQFAFVLYKGELSRYGITEGSSLTEELFYKIRNEIVLKRAKLRAMYLLKDMDRTEMQLRIKLKQNLYSEDIIEEALKYVKSFGYIEDLEYARRFISGKKCQKSKKEIYAALCQKGISKEKIEKVIEECYQEDGETDTIKKILDKKRVYLEYADDVEKRKIIQYLLRKGFRYDDIRQVIQVSEWDT